MSYSRDGKYIYFRHGDEHNIQLTEMYRTEQFRTGSSERIGQYVAKHIADRQVFPCTGNRETCEGCAKGVDKISSFKQAIIDLDDKSEKWFEMPISLMKIMIEKQKTFRDLLPNNESVLTAGYHVVKNAKGSDPLWTVTVVKKPVALEGPPKAEAVSLDLDDGGAVGQTFSPDAEGGVGGGVEDITFSKGELETIAVYNKRLANALPKNPNLDVAGSLRKSLDGKIGDGKIKAVLAAIGADNLVDLQSLKLEGSN